jgi:HEPN domain-containing protein
LKAELLRLGWFLEKTHDLERLSGELRSRRSDLLPRVDPLCDALTEVYFTERYPGFDLEDPDWPKFRAHLEQVARLLEIVKARVAGQGA